MKRAYCGFVFVIAAACGGKSTPPAACPAGPVMATEAQIQAVEQKMCGCGGDGECIAHVFQDDAAMGLTFGQVAEIAKARSQCRQETGEGEPPTTSPPPPSSSGSTGLAECDAYIVMIDKYVACDKVPQSARDAAKQGVDAMRSGWGQATNMPEDAKKAANDACAQAIDAVKQGMAAMGCPL